LEKIDKEFDVPLAPMFRYFNFGLLFPGIPLTHLKEWHGNRIIEFSEYEETKFEEIITWVEDKNNERLYNIEIKAFPDSVFEMKNCEGSISISKDELYVSHATLNVRFSSVDLVNEWRFEVEKI
jgi:hypothetical protein